ncbi:hypothetical protein BBO99_00002265 [Phytophthora kernoviae]|uniref:Protein phosphatase inhibitor 2 n=2 Tax=Phytophthora kernoviae TaxID=325452 RepID=A0A3R7KMJ0_9STRA|nr:hypothetical protein G195_002683 [Phytophthora kernoviae 00238/432]KAG2528652.1 hypothetical protein JM16_002572 [Phytophthora kernoviae]KAG2530496.1 hypothetical protein JM18_002119 [Phytophthora kernoviae]RLN10685.1 hypothetical protein BBI17_002202 [Phytophthora kernoviae]RLN83256.1 hypothetical protein BBO99_00002265 [Phytophthora kernoviae]
MLAHDQQPKPTEPKPTEPKPMEPKPALAHGHQQHQDSHVSWDEETIARHNLDRGTRMKIDEPNTPYHYYAESDDAVSPARSQSDQPPIQWDELQSKLQDVQDAKKSEWDSDDGDERSSEDIQFAARDAEGKKIKKDPQFAEKRKMHYNEFERVRAWKMQHAAEEENGEDEDEDEEKPSAKKSQ